MLASVGASCLSVGCVLIMGSPEVWIRPIRKPNGTWKLGFFCQESGAGQCYVEYLTRQGSGHRRYFLAQILERYIRAGPDMHKFPEGVSQAAFLGSGLTRVSKADRRAGRFSGPSVFGTWVSASYPFRWQSEYVRRSIGAPGLPPAFAAPPAGVQIFGDTRSEYDELPREIRTAHRDEVRKACVQLGLRTDRGRASDRGSDRDSRRDAIDRGSDRMRSRSRGPRRGSSEVVSDSEATSTAVGAPAVVAGPGVPVGCVSVRARVVSEVNPAIRALLDEVADEQSRQLLEMAHVAGL